MIEQLIKGTEKEKLEVSPLLKQFMIEIRQNCVGVNDIIFLCIGSDRSSGDAFGPIVGSLLQQLGFPHVIGTLADPCDAHSVERQINTAMKENKLIVAIDACLGHNKTVGQFLLNNGPIQPGAAIGRRLPFVGHYSIAGVVNEMGPKAYWKLQTTSLQLVLNMAAAIRTAAMEAWQLDVKGDK